MNKDHLRLIEMQDIASIAKDNMGDYRRVNNWGYSDKIALVACVGLIVLCFGIAIL